DKFIATRTGGLNGEYKSLEIDLSTGYFFNQVNQRGRMTPDDLKILVDIISSDQFKLLDPKYITPGSSSLAYRYTFSAYDKYGTTLDLKSKYPPFLDSLISIFERYNS
ncbi:hypothetical protein SAMD00019534_096210, partial [Acytostelium subglobosum LB1]|uniref:hypothetical protein n=1 Tax=Acytostelium subglobosum LB1 TaxID=1410327 RepID=UPI000644F87F